MSLHALLFDLDGTLADPERNGYRLACNAAFREFGLDWDGNGTFPSAASCWRFLAAKGEDGRAY